MKHVLIALSLLALSSSPWARDTPYKLPFEEVLNSPLAKEKLDGSVKFFLKGQATPKVISKLGEDMSNRKTNGVGNEDIEGCRHAALSVLIAFQEKAKTLGANAVIDMISYYKKVPFESATQYDCHAGATVIGVAMKGTYAKVAD